ncbi:MAG: DMT family transporter [Hyphomicrobiaceae bacterium]
MTGIQWTGSGDRSALVAIALMVLVAIFNAVDAVIVRLLSPDVHPFVIGFTRASFGLLVLLPWILNRPTILRSNYILGHVVRAILKLGSLVAFFAAFAVAPLAEVTAIAFAAPIFLTVGAWLFLAERPRSLRIIAVLVGFAGVLIVLRPGSEFSGIEGFLLALLGAVLIAFSHLVLKSMSARDSTETLVAWNLILTVPIAAVPAIIFWENPTSWQWGLLAVQGAMGALNMGLITKAFSLAEASFIAPIDFLRLPIVAGLAFVLFNQSVPMTTWLGGAAIFGASLLMAQSARRR